MLKYGKLKNASRPDSLLFVVLSFVQLLLVIVGLVGISIQFFRDKGWLKQWLSSIMHAQTSTLVVVIPVLLMVYLVGKSWMDSHSEKNSSSHIADAMLYIMMLVGIWFIYNYLSNGDI